MRNSSFEWFIAKRLTFQNKRAASILVVRLTLISIALAVATMEISLSVVEGFESEIQNKVVGFGSHIQLGHYFQNLDTEIEPLYKDEASLDSIRALPYVASVSPYIHRAALLKAESGLSGILLKGVGSEYDWSYFSTCLRSGKIPDFSSEKPSPEILISKKLANKLMLQTGDRARLFFIQEPVRRRPVRIAGIYETGMEEFDNHILICDIRMLQDIWDWEDNEVTGFEVNLYSLAMLDSATSEIQRLTPFFMAAVPVDQIFPELFDWLKQQHQTVQFILILMVIVAVINLCTMILVLIIERTRSIGILKALGMPSYRVQRVFLWNAALLIFVGVAAGNMLGLGILASQDWLGWIRVDQDNYFIETVPVAWVWDRFFLVNVGVVIVCTAAMLLPTIIVNRISPIRAIRYE